MVFSKNTPATLRTELADYHKIRVEAAHVKYLGLPAVLGRSKGEKFQQISEKLWRRSLGWKERFLSQAGRTVLVKLIMQAMPMYAMLCFRLPNKLLNKLTSITSAFWWNTGEGKKIHWFKWNDLCKSRNESLGFRELQSFNSAFLAKQAWRLATKPHCLLSKILKARYFPKISIFEARKGWNSSFS
ncbi:UNVERIFIED_CONTAM: hypothetical protein Slati_3412700 [Sesamum latifolium]|uniref:Reverse transcriptase n=1 Tax=Sesamum latifolium TaxID=2727402 RepID=A0AAW2UGB5_9LAMI